MGDSRIGNANPVVVPPAVAATAPVPPLATPQRTEIAPSVDGVDRGSRAPPPLDTSMVVRVSDDTARVAPEALLARLHALEGGEITPGVIDSVTPALRLCGVAERRMIAATLDEIEALRDARITPAQYMVNVMRHAAEIAGADRARFVELVGMAFSEGPSDGIVEMGREALGAGPHPFGWLLERIQGEIVRERTGFTAATGFAEGVLDVDPNSSITHHFGELLRVGFHSGAFLGDQAQDFLDGPENPGDVHNGYFAVMLGNALVYGEITPAEAVDMVARAFVAPGADFTLNPDDYTLDRFR